jgi:hypothetical protein
VSDVGFERKVRFVSLPGSGDLILAGFDLGLKAGNGWMLLDSGYNLSQLRVRGYRAQIGQQRPVRSLTNPTSQGCAQPFDVMTPILFLIGGELGFDFGGKPISL